MGEREEGGGMPKLNPVDSSRVGRAKAVPRRIWLLLLLLDCEYRGTAIALSQSSSHSSEERRGVRRQWYPSCTERPCQPCARLTC